MKRHQLTCNPEGSLRHPIGITLQKEPDLSTNPRQGKYHRFERTMKPGDEAGARFMNVDHLVEGQDQERLLVDLAQATRDLLEMQESQIAALKLGDQRIDRFDQEIAVALRVWKQARRAYMGHLQEHGCFNV